jgi:hypothetical protein
MLGTMLIGAVCGMIIGGKAVFLSFLLANPCSSSVVMDCFCGKKIGLGGICGVPGSPCGSWEIDGVVSPLELVSSGKRGNMLWSSWFAPQRGWKICGISGSAICCSGISSVSGSDLLV